MPLAEDLATLAGLRNAGDLTEEQFRGATQFLIDDYGAAPKAAPTRQPASKVRKPKQKLSLMQWLFLIVTVLGIFSYYTYKSPAERREDLRSSDPAAFAELVKQENAAAEVKAEKLRLAAVEKERLEAERAEADKLRIASEAAEASVAAVARAAEDAAKKQAGFHCLSGWDGSHSALIDWVKGQLNDPNSFEHDNTKVTPVNAKGDHSILMRYLAKNGFGGVVRGQVLATMRNSDCGISDIISSS